MDGSYAINRTLTKLGVFCLALTWVLPYVADCGTAQLQVAMSDMIRMM